MPKEQSFTVSREERDALKREVAALRAEVARVCAPSVLTIIIECAAQVWCVTPIDIIERKRHQPIVFARLAVWVVGHRLNVHPKIVLEKLGRERSMEHHMKVTASAALTTDREFSAKVDMIERCARRKIETIF